MIRIAALIDGGHLRTHLKKGGFEPYNPDNIEAVGRATASLAEGETLFRAFYYDCAPYRGEHRLPVSGKMRQFDGDDDWLQRLAAKDLFAVRRGVLKFRGFKPRRPKIAVETLTDADFQPDFEQKGVDMRIGLDIATFARTQAVQRVALITGDTDCIPAMKHARISGLQIVLLTLPGHRQVREMQGHADFTRPIEWPDGLTKLTEKKNGHPPQRSDRQGPNRPPPPRPRGRY